MFNKKGMFNKKDVQAVSDMVNSMSFHPEEFCEEMRKEHRTIQQNFTRLCFEWLKTCAAEDYPHDERNRASHVKCKEIVETMSVDPAWDFIPFI